MNEVIYYPTFEVSDQQWLKFAMLYLEKLNPIIPLAGDVELSDEFKRITGETDLIDIHRPNHMEGYSATLDAIEQVEKVLKHPDRYVNIFKPNFIKDWKAPQSHKTKLFEGKYTDDWEQFCRKEKLGKQTSIGLKVHEGVADLYMTLLAHVIADRRGVSPFTDNRQLDDLGIFIRRAPTSNSTTMETAQAVIRLELPANLEDISLKEIINQRNRNGFKNKRKAFHHELDAFISNTERGSKPGEFGESLGTAWTDFREDIVRLGLGVTGFTLGVWIALGAGPVGALKASQQIVGGLTLAIGSGISIRKTWKHTESKRFTRKYLADLHRIKLVN